MTDEGSGDEIVLRLYYILEKRSNTAGDAVLAAAERLYNMCGCEFLGCLRDDF